MGIFSDNAQELWEHGYSVIPLKKRDKAPFFDDWSKYCKDPADEETISEWANKYQNNNIGLCLGKATGLVGLDVDTQDERVFEIVKSIIPESPVKRFGQKGYLGFYAYSEQKNLKWPTKGKPILELLSNGRQCVLPPSIHPDTGEEYQWLTGDLRSCDDYPTIDEKDFFNIVKQIKIKCPDLVKKHEETKEGRNNYLKSAVASMWDNIDEPELIKRIIDLDKQKHRENPLFEDRNEFRHMTPKEAATKFVASIGSSIEQQKIDRGEEGKKSTTKSRYEEFETFFDWHLKGVRKNILGKQCLFIDKWGNEENAANMESYLRSKAIDEGYQPTKVADHLNHYLYELPPELLIDIPEWDGRDYISEMFSHVAFTNIVNSEAAEIFKEWGANVFRRLYNPKEQNKIIIFKGNQGIGKDTFVDHLCRGFGRYMKHISVRDKVEENFQVMIEALVLNIAEFDQTGRMHVSHLKDMITKDSATFRPPYGKAPKDYTFHCSFISTCNVEDILRDYTGNRRYVIFDTIDIDWEYPKEWSDSVLAQLYALYKQDFRTHKDINKKMDQYIASQTPDDPAHEMINAYVDKFKSQHPTATTETEYNWNKISDWASKLAIEFGFKPRQLQTILKRNGYWVRRGGQSYYKLASLKKGKY